MIKRNKDEVVLLLCIVMISPILISLDLFETIYNLTREYEKQELDELFIVFISILVCISFYALKKYFDLKKTQCKLLSNSQIDPLTKLKNRNVFFKVPQDNDSYLVLLNIIDFTVFNKHLGFSKADELLKNIATYLKKIVYETTGEEIYRIYGDEFSFYYKKNDIQKVLYEIKKRFEDNLFEVDSYKFYVNLNMAYSNIVPKYLTSTEALLISRKSLTKSIVKYNSQKIYCTNSLEMLNTIKYSLDKNLITPVYQAIYDNNSNTTYKYETLARIKKDQQLILPHEFIEVSKRFKLYHKITQSMIEKAFNDFKNSSCEFSINLSYIDITNEYTLNFIFSMLKNNPSIAKRLTIEFLETENIDDYKILIDFSNKIKTYGTKIAIDDFGSGYSNWNNIIKLKPNYIKIDGSIIQNLLGNEKNISLIKLIVQFSKINNIKTVAEFVDSLELAKLVKELKIDYSQGYFYAKPEEHKYISSIA